MKVAELQSDKFVNHIENLYCPFVILKNMQKYVFMKNQIFYVKGQDKCIHTLKHMKRTYL